MLHKNKISRHIEQNKTDWTQQSSQKMRAETKKSEKIADWHVTCIYTGTAERASRRNCRVSEVRRSGCKYDTFTHKQ